MVATNCIATWSIKTEIHVLLAWIIYWLTSHKVPTGSTDSYMRVQSPPKKSTILDSKMRVDMENHIWPSHESQGESHFRRSHLLGERYGLKLISGRTLKESLAELEPSDSAWDSAQTLCELFLLVTSNTIFLFIKIVLKISFLHPAVT